LVSSLLLLLLFWLLVSWLLLLLLLLLSCSPKSAEMACSCAVLFQNASSRCSAGVMSEDVNES